MDDACRLRSATADLERELPMPKVQAGVFCYEFPWVIEINVWRGPASPTAMQIVSSLTGLLTENMR